MAYKSPIEIIQEEAKLHYEDAVVKAIQPYLISVNKDELIAALKYDRAQYDNGYADGRAARDAEIIRCKDCAYATDEDEEGVYCSMNDNGFRLDDFCSLGEPIGEAEE